MPSIVFRFNYVKKSWRSYGTLTKIQKKTALKEESIKPGSYISKNKIKQKSFLSDISLIFV